MRVIVYGPQSIQDQTAVDWALDSFNKGVVQIIDDNAIRDNILTSIDEVVVMDKPGVSRLAINWAKTKHIDVKVEKANAFFRGGAATMRNFKMMKRVGPKGMLIVIYDGEDKFTKHLIEVAKKWFVPIKEIIIK